jgi:hypothetical protein
MSPGVCSGLKIRRLRSRRSSPGRIWRRALRHHSYDVLDKQVAVRPPEVPLGRLVGTYLGVGLSGFHVLVFLLTRVSRLPISSADTDAGSRPGDQLIQEARHWWTQSLDSQSAFARQPVRLYSGLDALLHDGKPEVPIHPTGGSIYLS